MGFYNLNMITANTKKPCILLAKCLDQMAMVEPLVPDTKMK